MVKAARLYDNAKEFSDMMRRQLIKTLNLKVNAKKDDPLLLMVHIPEHGTDEKVEISLHRAFGTYLNSGDLNGAIDYLNGTILSTLAVSDQREATLQVDTSRVYPALRDKEYVEQAGVTVFDKGNMEGLCTVYLMVKDGFSVIVNSQMLNGNLSENALKQIAHRNLYKKGWTPSSMQLPFPTAGNCQLETFFAKKGFPIDFQFVRPDLAKGKLPDTFLVAFPNRDLALMMRTEERLETKSEAMKLSKTTRFQEVVKRSHLVMPSPNSGRIYFFSRGEYKYLTRVV